MIFVFFVKTDGAHSGTRMFPLSKLYSWAASSMLFPQQTPQKNVSGNKGCLAPLHNGGAEDLKQDPTNQEGINQAVSSNTFYILSSICRLN